MIVRRWGVAVSARHLWFISLQLLHIGFLVFSPVVLGVEPRALHML